ncbi:MAG: hypothetical protein R8M38_03355 [Mariprofundaceae bacterium]
MERTHCSDHTFTWCGVDASAGFGEQADSKGKGKNIAQVAT